MRRRLFKNLITAPCTEALGEATAGFEAAGEELRGVIARRLGRSLAIREVDAGSGNGCELEIHALSNAFNDVERFGIDRKSTRLNSSHLVNSYAGFCLKK